MNNPVQETQLSVGEMPEESDTVWLRTKRPWSVKKRILAISLVLFVILCITTIAGVIWIQRQLNPPGPEGVEILIEIPGGASINDISRILTDKDIVANSTITRIWWRSAGPFFAGTYTFRENMSVNSAKAVLDAGPISDHDLITLPEGLWLRDIEQRLLANLPLFDPAELNTALRGNLIRSKYQPEGINNLEGLLFSDTYQVDESSASDELRMVQRLVSQFDLVLDEMGYANTQSLVGYSPYEVVIVASMVESEARVPEDRAKIARVIYNRLADDIALGIDATVLYALGEHKSVLNQEDLMIDSPYNTRLYKGLPPTPVSSPGREALEAALNPADGDWLYFVLADEDGSHFFTSDFNEFNRQAALSREQGLFK